MYNTKLSKKEKNYIDALIEGLEKLADKLSTTERNYIANDVIFCNTALNESDELLDAQEEWIESGCMKKYNKYNF